MGNILIIIPLIAPTKVIHGCRAVPMGAGLYAELILEVDH